MTKARIIFPQERDIPVRWPEGYSEISRSLLGRSKEWEVIVKGPFPPEILDGDLVEAICKVELRVQWTKDGRGLGDWMIWPEVGQ